MDVGGVGFEGAHEHGAFAPDLSVGAGEDAARRLLETHGEKVEYVARMAGYEQASAFTRAFRRWVGVSPSDYRDAQSVRAGV